MVSHGRDDEKDVFITQGNFKKEGALTYLIEM